MSEPRIDVLGHLYCGACYGEPGCLGREPAPEDLPSPCRSCGTIVR